MNKYWQGKKVLITGAVGFVGSNAVKYFCRQGADVSAVVSPKTEKKLIPGVLGSFAKKVAIIKVDLLEPNEAKKTVVGQEVIFNFAGLDGGLHYKNTHSAEIFSKNMRINLNMLQAAVEKKCKTFVLISSADIYAYESGEEITEQTPVKISWHEDIDGYKLAKWTSELAAREFHRQYGIDVLIVRPGNLYGPGDNFEDKERMRFIPTVIRKLILDEEPVVLWGSGNQTRSFLYVDDFLLAVDLLVRKKAFNFPINIASGNHLSMKSLARLIAKLAGVPANIKIDKSKESGAPARIFDLRKLKAITNISKETTMEEGLARTVEFVKKKYGP